MVVKNAQSLNAIPMGHNRAHPLSEDWSWDCQRNALMIARSPDPSSNTVRRYEMQTVEMPCCGGIEYHRSPVPACPLDAERRLPVIIGSIYE
jgi:hypothetical protein